MLKRSEPNSFERALAAGDNSRHPDADVLAAFAESTLLPRERDTVLAHLAGCAECRQVLALAADGAGEAVQPPTPFVVSRRPRLRFLIPTLAAAAVIAVVSTAVVRYQLKKVPQSYIAAKAPEEKPASPVPAQAAPAPVQASPAQSVQPAPEKHADRKAAHAPVTPARPAQPLTAPPAPSPDSLDRKRAEASTFAAMNRQLEMSKMAPRAAAQAGAIAGTRSNLATASASGLTAARPHWRINDQGQPERAFGDGPWQVVLPGQAARMQVVSVFGAEVWLGGEKSQVFRSFDNGRTWHIVTLPEKNGSDHTITHIRFDSAQKITVEAADGTAWTSEDGAASWQ